MHEHHEHEHHAHEHEGNMWKQIAWLAASALLLAACMLTEHYCQLPAWQLLLLYLVPYLMVGHETLHEAAEGIAHGDAFNEHLLMAVATIGALAIGFMPGADTEFAEAVFVMLFFQVGELFEGYAEGKSRQSIAHLMDIRPDTACVVRNGQELTVSPQDVEPGELIIVRPGEKIPIDGTVSEGASALNTVALTGESMPREVGIGDEVVSGCVNLTGLLHIHTTRTFGQSTASRIIELVEEAGEHKSRSEKFISRFARVYTPIVVFAAMALALLPPLLTGDFINTLPTWLHRALIFLVVSCPCALVISVPLTFFCAIGRASRLGILIKGANYIDTLANLSTVVFDKTGTLTHGQFAVSAVHPDRCDEERLLHLAAHVEHFSTHPIGAALRQAFPDEATDGCSVTDVEESAGMGISAKIGKDTVSVGNTKMMDKVGAQWHDCTHTGTIIHVAINGEYAGHIVINDTLKADSQEAISGLKERGVEQVVMLTGDRHATGQEVARQLGISNYHTELMPQQKVECVEQLLANKGDGQLAFVGDGINDAPVLARADVGIAMGALGAEAAIEAADVVLMDDQPSKIGKAIDIARRATAIAKQNVAFAIGVKVAVLLLASCGLGTMWMAVFADVGVTVLAVLNAMRT